MENIHPKHLFQIDQKILWDKCVRFYMKKHAFLYEMHAFLYEMYAFNMKGMRFYKKCMRFL